jgi:hypothetical protein
MIVYPVTLDILTLYINGENVVDISRYTGYSAHDIYKTVCMYRRKFGSKHVPYRDPKKNR